MIVYSSYQTTYLCIFYLMLWFRCIRVMCIPQYTYNIYIIQYFFRLDLELDGLGLKLKWKITHRLLISIYLSMYLSRVLNKKRLMPKKTLYPFHLSIPFTSLSLSLPYLSLPHYISPSTFLSLSLLLFLLLSIFLFGVSKRRFRPCSF